MEFQTHSAKTFKEARETCQYLGAINLIGHCPFCFRLLETDAEDSDIAEASQEPFSSFHNVWSHLFRKFDHQQQLSPVPKFEFVSERDNQKSDSSFVQVPAICSSCHEEVSRLQMLHRKLEEVREKLNCQVVQLRKIIRNGFSEHGRFEKLLSSRSDLDNREIQSTLRFLGYLRKYNSLDEHEENEVKNEVTDDAINIEEEASIKSEPPSDIENDEQSGEDENEDNPETKCGENDDDDSDFTFEDEELMEMQSSDDEVRSESTSKTDPLQLPIARTRPRKQTFSVISSQDPIGTSPDQDPQATPRNVPKRAPTRTTRPDIKEISKEVSATPTYHCKTCNKPFTKGKSLYAHERHKHPGIKPDRLRRDFECKECGKSFSSAFYLKQHHRINHTEDGLFKCDYCPKAFQTPQGLKLHNEVAHSETKRRFPCETCGKDFPYSHNLQRHQRKVHQNPKKQLKRKAYLCDDAACKGKASFVSERALNSHKVRVHTPRNCSQCSETFTTTHALTQHLKRAHDISGATPNNKNNNHSGNDADSSNVTGETSPSRTPDVNKHADVRPEVHVYHCKTCSKPFPNVRRRYAHELKYHPGIKPDSLRNHFKCRECGKSFASNFYLKWHHRVKHTEDGRFKCDKCPKTFETAQGRNVHYEIAHLENKRRFPCDICGKGFPYACNLKRHMEKVHKQKFSSKQYEAGCKRLQFHCDDASCDAAFATENALKNHQARVHEQQPFVCAQCSKPFETKLMLTRHIKQTHKGEGIEGIVCEDCGNTFTCQKTLKTHRFKKHNPDLQPVPCELCGKQCRHKEALRSHIKEVHRKGAFICEVCGAQFGTGRSLQTHHLTHQPHHLKPFQCHLCPSRFDRSNRLQHHLSVHAKGRKPRTQAVKSD